MKKIYPLIYSDILQYYYAEEFGITRQLAYVKKQHIWINDEYCGRISVCFDLRKKFLFLKSKKEINTYLIKNNIYCFKYIDFDDIKNGMKFYD